MGRGRAPVGVQGWVKVVPFTGAERPLARRRWVPAQERWREVAVEARRPCTARWSCAVDPAATDPPRAAAALEGSRVAVPRERAAGGADGEVLLG